MIDPVPDSQLRLGWQPTVWLIRLLQTLQLAVVLVLQSGRRALTTANAQCVCAVLGQLNNLLTTALYPQLHAKLEVTLRVCSTRCF